MNTFITIISKILSLPITRLGMVSIVGAPILLALTIIFTESIISPNWFSPHPVFAYYESRPYPQEKLQKLRKLVVQEAKKKQMAKKTKKILAVVSGDDLFIKYGDMYHISPGVLKTIASCESSFNPTATNGVYGGMFQFHPNTWLATRQRMGEDTSNDSRFSSEESIKTAAYKISQEGTGAWPVCGRV